MNHKPDSSSSALCTAAFIPRLLAFFMLEVILVSAPGFFAITRFLAEEALKITHYVRTWHECTKMILSN
jgi:hypothetical protein